MMGLFSRKPQEVATTKTAPRPGWTVECGPLCGFVVRDHEKQEIVQITMLHMKQTHKTTLTEAEALASVKPTTL